METSPIVIFGIQQCSWEEIASLLAACLLGGILGLERELTRHPAGLRTHILVSLGSAAILLMAFYLMRNLEGDTKFDPGRAIAGVVTGMGFIGAGAIMKEGASIHGITTAASLWVAAAVGMLCSAGAYGLAIFTTLLATATMAFQRRNPIHPAENPKPAAPEPRL